MERNKLDVLSMVTKETLESIEKTNELVEDAFATDVSFEEMRENYIKERVFWNEGGPEMKKTLDEELEINGRKVKLRFHYPSLEKELPVIVFIHGGGFVVGNLDTHDRMMRILADESEALVVGIDYSLSPEAKYPTALKECAYVVNYIRENSEKYDLDPSSISFAGDSGGANLSLGTTLYLRDQGDDIDYIKSLLLYYGSFGLTDSPSMRLLGGEWDGLTKKDLDSYAELYLEDIKDHSESIYYNCLNADLSKYVPPTFILYAELDPLRDDSITLYEMLNAQGHTTELVEYKGLIHAFLHHSRMVPEATEALVEGSNFFKKHK